MNTRPIPAIIMMIAGFITCLLAVFNRTDVLLFTQILLGVLVGFYILGCIVKFVLDKGFAIMEEKVSPEETEQNTEEAETLTENENKMDENHSVES